MFKLDPTTFSDTRIQLHWASQLLSAAADVTLAKAEDDSHSNLEWDATSNKLLGRSGCNINVANFELEANGDTFAMTAKSLTESADWLSEKLAMKITFRDYDMPDHAVANGSVFAPNRDHLIEIANWFSFGQTALTGNGELRVWPHHFDLGFWVPGAVEGKSIGGGISPGDDNYNQPYIYINPYGFDKPESLPELAAGSWTTHWFGAVLTADSIVGSEDSMSLASDFVRSAIEACERLISDQD